MTTVVPKTVTTNRAAPPADTAAQRPETPPARPGTAPWVAVAAAVAGTERAAAVVRARVATALSGGTAPPAAHPAAAPAAAPRTAAPPEPPADGNGLPGLDRARHPAWATVLADPVLPRFAPEVDGPVSFAAPAEQGLWRDITLASRVTAAVRAGEMRYEAAFDAAPTPLLIATAAADGRPQRVLSANAAMARLLGYARADLLDLSVRDLAPTDYGPLLADPEAADPAVSISCWRRADGTPVPVLVRVAAVSGAAEIVLQVEATDHVTRERAGGNGTG